VQVGKGQKTVVVLGEARSGTSVTAGILAILGVDMGSVYFSTKSNPKGSFEDRDVQKLNREFFSEGRGREDLLGSAELQTTHRAAVRDGTKYSKAHFGKVQRQVGLGLEEPEDSSDNGVVSALPHESSFGDSVQESIGNG
jgi:hypothetical protein